MKRINSLLEIDFSLPVIITSLTYVLDKGVIIHLKKYMNGKMDIMVTNANYSDKVFSGKSYGNNYVTVEWIEPLLANWVKQSEI